MKLWRESNTAVGDCQIEAEGEKEGDIMNIKSVELWKWK